MARFAHFAPSSIASASDNQRLVAHSAIAGARSSQAVGAGIRSTSGGPAAVEPRSIVRGDDDERRLPASPKLDDLVKRDRLGLENADEKPHVRCRQRDAHRFTCLA